MHGLSPSSRWTRISDRVNAGLENPAAALLRRSIDLGTYMHETASAWESLGDIAARQGNRDEAIAYYRLILSEQPSLSGTSGTVEISLAEVLLSSRQQPDIGEAIGLLDSWMNRDGLNFNSRLFRWHLALIEAAEAIGDRETARRSALVALQLAERGPQLPRHKDVGLIRTDEATLRRLKVLSK